MNPQQPGHLGDVWQNLMFIKDYSTGQNLCEIHLEINLGSDADVGQYRSALEQAIHAPDKHAPKLKQLLKARLKANGHLNESTEKMVEAIVLRV